MQTQRIIRILLAIILATSALVGVRSISHYHNKVEVQHLELKSSQLKARTLELEYDQALKQLDNKNATEQQLKDAQDKLNQLEQQKKDLEAQLQAKAAAKTNVVYAAPAASAVTGSNVYMDYIFQHESGGNPYAVNSIGACGLGQALPCSKMGCQLSDVACQISYFTSYAVARYGGWQQAYNFWVANRWW